MSIISRRGLFILLIAAVLMCGCTNVFFQPSRYLYVDPTKLSVQPQELYFQSKDGTKLTGWLFRAPGNAKPPLVLHFHGNAENMTSHVRNVYWLVEQGFDLMVFDYRGYGASSGVAQASGIVEDAEAALQEALRIADGGPFIIYGQSLGGNLALRAVSRLKDRHTIKAMVIDSSFWSYQAMASSMLAKFWWGWPLQWLGCVLVSGNYDPKPLLSPSDGAIPTVVMHATDDPIVPFAQGKALYKQLPSPKCFWQIDTQGHTNGMHLDKGRWRPLMLDFLRSGTCQNQTLLSN